MMWNVILKFRIRLGIRDCGFEKKIRNYSKIPNYSEMAIPIHMMFFSKDEATVVPVSKP